MVAAVEKFVALLCRLLALCGGLVLILLTFLIVASIIGRTFIPLGLKPIPGDFELIEAGMAFAVFAFLPWCHLQNGHARITAFTGKLPAIVQHGMDTAINCFMLVFAYIILKQHIAGLIDKQASGETSFILQYPIWWGYAAAATGAYLLALISLVIVLRSIIFYYEYIHQGTKAS